MRVWSLGSKHIGAFRARTQRLAAQGGVLALWLTTWILSEKTCHVPACNAHLFSESSHVGVRRRRLRSSAFASSSPTRNTSPAGMM